MKLISVSTGKRHLLLTPSRVPFAFLISFRDSAVNLLLTHTLLTYRFLRVNSPLGMNVLFLHVSTIDGQCLTAFCPTYLIKTEAGGIRMKEYQCSSGLPFLGVYLNMERHELKGNVVNISEAGD